MRIEDICKLFTDGDWIESKDQSSEGIRLIQTGNIGQGQYIEKGERAKYISEDTFERLKCTEIFSGDILVSRLPDPIGRACIIPHKAERMITAVDCTICRPDEGIVQKEYLCYFMQSEAYYNRLMSNVTGTTRKRISRKNLGNVEMDIPPLCVQEDVVKKLDIISNIISMRKLELEHLDELIKARFVEMFGDLADPACAWYKCKIVEVCVSPDDIKCGPFGTQLSKDEYTTKGVAVWEIPQINSEFNTLPTHFVALDKAKELEAYSIVAGDIAMSRKGNVGRCAVFPETFEDGIIHSDVLRIRVDKSKIEPEFLMRQLHYSGDVQHQIELVSSGAIMAGINVTKLKQIDIYVPPFGLQGRFVEFIKQVDKSKVVVQKALDEAQTLFNSLMQEYFG